MECKSTKIEPLDYAFTLSTLKNIHTINFKTNELTGR